MGNEVSTELLMTRDEARKAVKAIREKAVSLAEDLRDLHDRMGWQALGYDSWAECIKQEFDYSKSHANRLIAAAKTRERLANRGGGNPPDRGGDTNGVTQSPGGGDVPEAHARQLQRLPEHQQADCYLDYIEECEEQEVRPTAAGLREKVDAWLADNEDPEPDKGMPDLDEDRAPDPPPPAKPPEKILTEAEREAADAKGQIGIWADTIGRWLSKSPSIDDFRRKYPGDRGDVVVKRATELYEALRKWKRSIK